MAAPRLAVLCDYSEERWPSMDLVAGRLIETLSAHHSDRLAVTRVQPSFRRRFSVVGDSPRVFFNADRLINRTWDYPRVVRRLRQDFDLFHVADHSYGFLAAELPGHRTGVYCHDLDIFRPITNPEGPRPMWARWLARRALAGMQSAAVVFYSTDAVRQQMERHRLIERRRLIHAPYGVAPVFREDAAGLEELAPLPHFWRRIEATPYLLHVGSCIPRKRIDVLLEVFARARARRPDLVLLQVGGQWTPAHERRIAELGLGSAVLQARDLDVTVLAALYRRAAATVLTSDQEGFGLPIIEALACGSVVVASDLPVTREVGGDAAVYCRVADVEEWSAVLGELMDSPERAPSAELRRAQAARFSWARHAQIIAEAYQGLLRSS